MQSWVKSSLRDENVFNVIVHLHCLLKCFVLSLHFIFCCNLGAESFHMIMFCRESLGWIPERLAVALVTAFWDPNKRNETKPDDWFNSSLQVPFFFVNRKFKLEMHQWSLRGDLRHNIRLYFEIECALCTVCHVCCYKECLVIEC